MKCDSLQPQSADKATRRATEHCASPPPHSRRRRMLPGRPLGVGKCTTAIRPHPLFIISEGFATAIDINDTYMSIGTDRTELGKIDPELAKILQGIKPVPRPSSIVELRRFSELLARKKVQLAASDGVSIEDRQIPMRDGSEITIRVYSPAEPPPQGSPLLVYYHSSGWCIGGLENDDVFFRTFCQKFGCVCVTVDYRLAPEHPFPTGHHDAEDALKWVAANASSVLKATPSRGFIIGGSSAGATFAAGLNYIARDEKLDPPVTGVWLNVPCLITAQATPEQFKSELLSFEELKDVPGLDRSTIDLFIRSLNADPMSPLMNPLIYPTGHKGLPPVYFQICGLDPLRDEGLLYERILREEGVQTKIDIYPGLSHCFWLQFPMLSSCERVSEDSVVGFEWLLSSVSQERLD